MYPSFVVVDVDPMLDELTSLVSDFVVIVVIVNAVSTNIIAFITIVVVAALVVVHVVNACQHIDTLAIIAGIMLVVCSYPEIVPHLDPQQHYHVPCSQ